MNWTKKLARFAPPGDDLRTALIAYMLALLVFVVFWGLGFFSGYRQALRELYEFRYGAQVLRNGAVMASLNSLIRHRLSGFWVYLLVCGFNAAANYALPDDPGGRLRSRFSCKSHTARDLRGGLSPRRPGALHAAGGNFTDLGGVFLMLEIKDLCKRYADKQALDHVSLTVGPGEIVGLFGENGAGKTTLMKCILSLIRYDSGSVTLDGAAITRANIGRFSFATCEHSFFPALSAQAHREFYEEHFETFLSRRFEGLMEFFGLPMDKPIRSFSTGQKNQFEVIMALSQGADYILMDEPFAGNDVFNREDFYKVLLGILEPHETVILSTHLIEEVTGFIGRAVLLHEGKIVGDAQTAALDEQGLTLMEYVKQTFSYQSDRVSKALAELTGREDDDA